MTKLFEEFRDTLDEINKKLSKQFKKGATEKQIGTLSKISDAIPNSYIEFLRCANGQKVDVGSVFGVFELLSTNRVVADYRQWKKMIGQGEFEEAISEPDKGITSEWWSNSWIPIASNGRGDYICIDNAPTEHGTKGQIICAYHDDLDRELLAKSFEDYISDLVVQYRTGDARPYIFSEHEDDEPDIDDPDEEEKLAIKYAELWEWNAATLYKAHHEDVVKVYGHVIYYDSKRRRYTVDAITARFYLRGDFKIGNTAPFSELTIKVLHLGKHARAFRLLDSKTVMDHPRFCMEVITD